MGFLKLTDGYQNRFLNQINMRINLRLILSSEYKIFFYNISFFDRNSVILPLAPSFPNKHNIKHWSGLGI